MFKNWKTTAAGTTCALPVIIEGINTKDFGKIAWGVGLLLIGLFAKDSDKN